MPKFLVDAMLAKLARFLRLLGFDAEYSKDKKDEELIEISLKEDRILLTRDYALSKVKKIKTIYIKSIDLKEQVRQILEELNLNIDSKNFFTICLECNSKLNKIEKSEIKGKIPMLSYKVFEEFTICPNCKRIYWKGSHYYKLLEKIEELLSK